jgi:hypothetical protein
LTVTFLQYPKLDRRLTLNPMQSLRVSNFAQVEMALRSGFAEVVSRTQFVPGRLNLKNRKKTGTIPAFYRNVSKCDFLAISEGRPKAHTYVNDKLPKVERGGVLNDQVWRF